MGVVLHAGNAVGRTAEASKAGTAACCAETETLLVLQEKSIGAVEAGPVIKAAETAVGTRLTSQIKRVVLLSTCSADSEVSRGASYAVEVGDFAGDTLALNQDLFWRTAPAVHLG